MEVVITSKGKILLKKKLRRFSKQEVIEAFNKLIPRNNSK